MSRCLCFSRAQPIASLGGKPSPVTCGDWLRPEATASIAWTSPWQARLCDAVATKDSRLAFGTEAGDIHILEAPAEVAIAEANVEKRARFVKTVAAHQAGLRGVHAPHSL